MTQQQKEDVLRLVKAKPYLTQSDVDSAGLVTISKAIKREDRFQPLRGDALTYTGSVLDVDVDTKGGAIPIPEGFKVFNVFAVRVASDSRYLSAYKKNVISVAEKTCPEEVHVVGKNTYVYVPPGISTFYTTETGINVTTDLQKRYDDLVTLYLQWVGNDSLVTNEKWIIKYTELIESIVDVLSDRGGLYEEAVSCQWPFSTRAVVVPDPNLDLDQISLPPRVLISWVKRAEFREVNKIPEELSNREAIRLLHNRRVMVGRQPSHDRSNLLSFRLKVISDQKETK